MVYLFTKFLFDGMLNVRGVSQKSKVYKSQKEKFTEIFKGAKFCKYRWTVTSKQCVLLQIMLYFTKFQLVLILNEFSWNQNIIKIFKGHN